MKFIYLIPGAIVILLILIKAAHILNHAAEKIGQAMR
jgi:hypothetical protein